MFSNSRHSFSTQLKVFFRAAKTFKDNDNLNELKHNTWEKGRFCNTAIKGLPLPHLAPLQWSAENLPWIYRGNLVTNRVRRRGNSKLLSTGFKILKGLQQKALQRCAKNLSAYISVPPRVHSCSCCHDPPGTSSCMGKRKKYEQEPGNVHLSGDPALI